jgi:ATP-dependent RNA helicase DeaD
MTFEELGLKEEVLTSLTELGFETPTPIQEKAIPHLLGEDSDFVGLAQTGTGKTAAFGLPLVNKIDTTMRKPQGLIICPTRELCLQISKDLKAYAKNTKVSVVAVYGGTDIRKQMRDIKSGVNIVVATPGRLCDLVNRKALYLADIETVVLDEADEMLNMGFKEDIDFILDQTPVERSVWLFSATMPKEVANIAKNYMDKPLEVAIGHKNQTNENISHIYFSIQERDRYRALKRLIDFNPNIYGLVFCRTRRETAEVAERLGKEGYSAEPLHGDLSQQQRDRVMDRFRRKDLQLLVATDVAARGIDVSDITHVINYNLPDEIENYTHRSGRTARAGKKGESLVLISNRESNKIRIIEKKIRTTFVQGTIPTAEEVCEIQLKKLIHNVVSAEVKEDDMAKFMPMVMEQFDDLSKEEVVKLFVSAEFNKFIEYYERAGDLNAKGGRDRGERSDRGDRNDRGDRRDRGERGERRDRGERRERNDENKTRFFVNLGKKDGLNPGGLLRVVCDSTGLNSGSFGKIDILSSYSFFEADKDLADKILSNVNGADYEGNEVSVEVTKDRPDRDSGGGRDRDRGQRSDSRDRDSRSSSRDSGDRGRSFGDDSPRERRSSGGSSSRRPSGGGGSGYRQSGGYRSSGGGSSSSSGGNSSRSRRR